MMRAVLALLLALVGLGCGSQASNREGRDLGGSGGGAGDGGSGGVAGSPAWSGEGKEPRLAVLWESYAVTPNPIFQVAASDLAVLPGAIDEPPASALVQADGYSTAIGLILAVEDGNGDGQCSFLGYAEADFWDIDFFGVLPPDTAVGIARSHVLFYVRPDPDTAVTPPLSAGMHLMEYPVDRVYCGFPGDLQAEVPLDTPVPISPVPASGRLDESLCYGPPCIGDSVYDCVPRLMECLQGACAESNEALLGCESANACDSLDDAEQEPCIKAHCNAERSAFWDCVYECFYD